MDAEATPDANPKPLTIDTAMQASATPSSGPSTGANTPTNHKIPVKPALKITSSFDDLDGDVENDDEGNHVSSGGQLKKKATKKKKKNRTLKWDEAKIQEHDQLRGTRMKIDEPNTPYAANYDSGSETDGSISSHKANAHHKISWDALTNKLEAHAAVAGGVGFCPSSPSSHGGATSEGHTTDEEDQDQKRERQRRELKTLEFQEHRKRHYNEMEVVRRFRLENPDGEPRANGHSTDEDDEDNDGDDENE